VDLVLRVQDKLVSVEYLPQVLQIALSVLDLATMELLVVDLVPYFQVHLVLDLAPCSQETLVMDLALCSQETLVLQELLILALVPDSLTIVAMVF
jgi:hypothetical protein